MNILDRRKGDRSLCCLNAVISSDKRTIGWGLVYNVADGGLGLATTEPYQPGTTVRLDFPEEAGPSMVVKVARIEYRPEVGWLVACEFADEAPAE